MNKYNNPRLLNTVVSGTGMKHPVTPHVVVGDQSNGFIRGDLMDANAVIDQITQSTALLNLTVNSIMTDAPLALDSFIELSNKLGDNDNIVTGILNSINTLNDSALTNLTSITNTATSAGVPGVTLSFYKANAPLDQQVSELNFLLAPASQSQGGYMSKHDYTYLFDMRHRIYANPVKYEGETSSDLNQYHSSVEIKGDTTTFETTNRIGSVEGTTGGYITIDTSALAITGGQYDGYNHTDTIDIDLESLSTFSNNLVDVLNEKVLYNTSTLSFGLPDESNDAGILDEGTPNEIQAYYSNLHRIQLNSDLILLNRAIATNQNGRILNTNIDCSIAFNLENGEIVYSDLPGKTESLVDSYVPDEMLSDAIAIYQLSYLNYIHTFNFDSGCEKWILGPLGNYNNNIECYMSEAELTIPGFRTTFTNGYDLRYNNVDDYHYMYYDPLYSHYLTIDTEEGGFKFPIVQEYDANDDPIYEETYVPFTDLSALNKAFSDTGISENNITLMCDTESGYAGRLNLKIQDGDSFNRGDIMYSMYGDTIEFYRRETASDVLNGEYTQKKYASLEDIIDAGNSVVVEDTHVNNSVYYGDEICVGRLHSTDSPLYTRTITYTITDQDANWRPEVQTLSDFDRVIDLPTDINVKTIEVLSGNVSWYSSVSNDFESSAPINDVFKLFFTKGDFSGSGIECYCNINFRASLATTVFDPAGDGADTIDIRFTIRYAKEV